MISNLSLRHRKKRISHSEYVLLLARKERFGCILLCKNNCSGQFLNWPQSQSTGL